MLAPKANQLKEFFFIIFILYGTLGSLGEIGLKQLSVIISSGGRWALLEGLLKSLYQQSLNRDLWELHVVYPENITPDPKILHKASYLNAKWSTSRRLNASMQRNIGLEQTTTPIVYFLDEDCELPRERHLQTLLQTFDQYPNVHVLGGSYRNHKNCSEFGRAYNAVCRLWQKRMTENLTMIPNITPLLGGNLAYRRQEAPLQFDETLGFGAEDLAFVQSAEQLGLSTLLSEQLYVYHNAQHSRRAFFDRARLHGRARAKLKNKSSAHSLWTDVRVFASTPAPITDKYRAGLYFLTVRMHELKSKLM